MLPLIPLLIILHGEKTTGTRTCSFFPRFLVKICKNLLRKEEYRVEVQNNRETLCAPPVWFQYYEKSYFQHYEPKNKTWCYLVRLASSSMPVSFVIGISYQIISTYSSRIRIPGSFCDVDCCCKSSLLLVAAGYKTRYCCNIIRTTYHEIYALLVVLYVKQYQVWSTR